MNRYFALIFLSLAIGGCSALDSLMTPGIDPVTGAVIDSPLVAVSRPFTDATGPWGEVVLTGIIALQNLYLAQGRVRRKAAEKKDADEEKIVNIVNNAVKHAQE